MDLLYTLLLVSSLIFIHESGHFAFAKIFGVKVLTFSIGFGPKIVRIRGKDAQGKDFEEDAQTLAINAHGGLILLTARLISGAVVQMKHNKTEEEQECHVAFLGPVRSGKAEIARNTPTRH